MDIKYIVFDADGTLLEVENPYLSIAEGLGCKKEVSVWVKEYLDDKLSYKDLIHKETEIFINKYQSIYKEFPRTGDLERFFYPPKLREGVDDIINSLHEKNIEIFVLSSGFYYLVKDLYQLNITRGNIYSNRLIYDTEGKFMGFKIGVEGEKIQGFGKILDENKIDFNRVAYVGDNAFDLKLINFVLKNDGQIFLYQQGEKDFKIENVPTSTNLHLITKISDLSLYL